jgi:hypothetical protein
MSAAIEPGTKSPAHPKVPKAFRQRRPAGHGLARHSSMSATQTRKRTRPFTQKQGCLEKHAYQRMGADC